MSEITIVKKPPDISLDEINYVIEKCFTSVPNVRFATTRFDEGLFEKLTRENELTCFVAMDNEKVVGTITYTVVNWKRWYHMGTAAKLRYVAVLPEYRRQHIATDLMNEVKGHAEKNGYDVILLSTPAKNKVAISAYKEMGFEVLLYKILKDRAVLELGYWKNRCPYSALHIKSRYVYSKIKSKLRFFYSTMKSFVKAKILKR